MRVCVVGAGSIGREFALNHFQPGATQTRVACIVDRDAERASALAIDAGSVLAGAALVADQDASLKKYRSKPSTVKGEAVPHFTSLNNDALALCDVVYIGTTPNSHCSLTLAAIAAGKHVILEKPLAATAADADAIVAAAESAKGIVISMNIGMRWNEAIKTMRTQIEDKTIGQVKSARMKLGFITWPRIWQQVPWCAEREQGGALREVRQSSRRRRRRRRINIVHEITLTNDTVYLPNAHRVSSGYIECEMYISLSLFSRCNTDVHICTCESSRRAHHTHVRSL